MIKKRFFLISLLVLGIGFVLTTCKEEIVVNKIKLNETALTLRPEATAQLSAAVEPSGSKAVVEWSSSDANVATIDQSGKVTAKSEGDAVILASSGGKEAKCFVTVSDLKKISVSPDSLQIAVGETEKLRFSTNPSEYKESTDVRWSSSDEKIVKVNDDGKITAIAVGRATIKARAEGKGDSCVLEVIKERIHVTGVSFSKTELTIMETEVDSLKITVLPENATKKTYSLENSDPTVARIGDKGDVLALKVGETTLTVITDDGQKTASCKVTVIPLAVKEIVLPASEYIEKVGDNKVLTVEVLPKTLPDSMKQVVWTSLNPTILEVDKNGKVTGKGKGVGKVRATHSKVSSIFAECEITVEMPPVTGVSISPTTWEGFIKETKQLTATISPENAGSKTLTWKSSNETVATVSSSGLVTAKSDGKTTITATSNNGIIAECKVTVKKRYVESVNISSTTLEMSVNEVKTLTATVTPSNATEPTLQWSSSKPNFATVDQTGKVTAVAQGTTTITASATDGSGKKATCQVTVKVIKVTSFGTDNISLSQSPLLMNIGDRFPEIIAYPSNATNKNYTVASSNSSVVQVSGKTITAKAAGKSTITLKSEDGNKTQTFEVNVDNRKIYRKRNDKLYSADCVPMPYGNNFSNLVLIAATGDNVYYGNRSTGAIYRNDTKLFTLPSDVSIEKNWVYGSIVYTVSLTADYNSTTGKYDRIYKFYQNSTLLFSQTDTDSDPYWYFYGFYQGSFYTYQVDSRKQTKETKIIAYKNGVQTGTYNVTNASLSAAMYATAANGKLYWINDEDNTLYENETVKFSTLPVESPTIVATNGGNVYLYKSYKVYKNNSSTPLFETSVYGDGFILRGNDILYHNSGYKNGQKISGYNDSWIVEE